MRTVPWTRAFSRCAALPCVVLALATLLSQTVLLPQDALATSPISRIDGLVEPPPSGSPVGPPQVTLHVLDVETLEYQPQAQFPVDASGRFELEIPVPEPDLVMLSAPGTSKAYLILDRPETLRVVLRSREAGGVVVEGSSGNTLERDFSRLLNTKNAEYFDDLKRRGEVALTSGQRDTAEVHRLEALRDRNLARFESDLGQALEAMGRSAAVYSSLRFVDVFKQRRLFEAAHRRWQGWNPDAKITRLLARVLERSARADVGAMAPLFSLPDAEGTTVRLDTLQGRWVLVDFWASWCLNCRFEMPRLAQVYAEWHDRGFEILGITARDQPDAWRATLTDEALPWPNLWDGDAAVTDRYLVTGQLPANFLLDPEGRIVARNLDATALQEALALRLANP